MDIKSNIVKLLKALIDSNIYISIAAVMLTVASQIQLGMSPQWHPYLFIIFFATLFEYNLHKLITVLTNKESLEWPRFKWIKDNLMAFYILAVVSVLAFIIVAFLAKKEVLIALTPIALLTVFYSLPIFKSNRKIFRLREIPYIKIFIIATVWSLSTILLPIIQSTLVFDVKIILLMLVERFLFILAITIPFDIRDSKADTQVGLKTLPTLVGEKKALNIASLALLGFFILSFYHYIIFDKLFLLLPLIISSVTTFIILKNKKIKALSYYHYGILDGTMLLQGLLVLLFYYVYKL